MHTKVLHVNNECFIIVWRYWRLSDLHNEYYLLMQVLHVLISYTMKDYQKKTNICKFVIHNEGLYFDVGIVKNSLFFI
jgi:hypothetical protein